MVRCRVVRDRSTKDRVKDRVAKSHAYVRARWSRTGSAHRKTLFVQHRAVLGPELDSPAARAFAIHRVATVCAVPAWAGLHANVDRLVQAIAPVPTMRYRRGAAGLDLRVEEQQAGRDRKVRRIASPFLELGAEPRFDHRWSFGYRCCRDSAGPHSIGAAFNDLRRRCG